MISRLALASSALTLVLLVTTINDRRWTPPAAVPTDFATSTVMSPVVGTAFRQAPIRQAPVTTDCDPRNPRPSLRPKGPLPTPGHLPADSTMAHIAQHGNLVVGVLQDTQPFAFRDVNLQWQGFEIDIARDIAEAIFGDRERVIFRPVPEAERFEIAASGKVDLVIATATITCHRRELVDFSTVYYEAGQRVLVNRSSAAESLDDLQGKRVCATRGSTSLNNILADHSKPIPVGVASATDCLMMLQLGEVDAISTDDTLLAGMAAQDPQTKVVGPKFTEEPYGIAINKNTPDLLLFVNTVLEKRAQDGRWRDDYEHWLILLGPPPAPPLPQYRD